MRKGAKKPGKKARPKGHARPPKLKTRISQPLVWLGRYLLRVQRSMPTMDMPKAIRSFRPNLEKEHRTLGSCCIEGRTINMATHSIKERTINGRRRRVLVPLKRLEILQTFAHELSHLAYEKHGYEQEWFGRTIFNAFGLTEPCPHCAGKGKIPARYDNT